MAEKRVTVLSEVFVPITRKKYDFCYSVRVKSSRGPRGLSGEFLTCVVNSLYSVVLVNGKLQKPN